MKLINKTNKQKKGFSLVELLAVLGVGGAMVAGALMLVSDVQEKRAIKTHSENISTIFNNMQSLFSAEPVSGNMTNLITAGVFPAAMSQTASTVSTLGGGDVAIAPLGGSDGYTLVYGKIAADTCVEVIRGQRNIGWDRYIVVAGNTGTAPTDSTGTAFSAASVPTIAGDCATAATGDWVSLGFYIQ
tara:strand:+ start:548 stop:1108 length:561 start_codon:yes stop_codon:yes gene_type:complete